MPSTAEIMISNIGGKDFFLINLYVSANNPTMLKMIIPFQLTANSSPMPLMPNSTDKNIIDAVPTISPITVGRMPVSIAFTGPEVSTFLNNETIKRIIKKDGKITPSVATSEPKMPPSSAPTNVAIFTATGPGVDSDTARMFMNCSSVSQPFKIAVSLTKEIIAYPPPNESAPIAKKL